MRYRLIVIFLMIVGVSNAQEFVGKVTAVLDANTIEVTNKNKQVIKVRFKEIELPVPGQMYESEARNYLKKQLLQKKVKVEFRGKDWRGNKLADIIAKGKNMQESLLKLGFAWVKERGDKKLIPIQDIARNNKIGLWEEDDPTPPWIYRRQQTMTVAKSR